jgi:hypothetical protein
MTMAGENLRKGEEPVVACFEIKYPEKTADIQANI